MWDIVEKQLRGGEDGTGQFIRMQIIRLKTMDGLKTVGILVPYECSDQLSCELAEDAEDITEVDINEAIKEEGIKVEGIKVEGIKVEGTKVEGIKVEAVKEEDIKDLSN